jgi:hypothetical protein
VKVCGEVCREELAQFIVFIFLFKKKLHTQQTSPSPNPKESTRRQNFLNQIYSFKSLWHNLDYQFVGPVF